MFTMDGGETFLTSVTDINGEMKSIKIKFVDTFHSTEEGITAISLIPMVMVCSNNMI